MTDPMTEKLKPCLLPKCDFCGKEQLELGGLLFGPPNEGLVEKLHVCVECYRKLNVIASDAALEAEKAKVAMLVKVLKRYEFAAYDGAINPKCEFADPGWAEDALSTLNQEGEAK